MVRDPAETQRRNFLGGPRRDISDNLSHMDRRAIPIVGALALAALLARDRLVLSLTPHRAAARPGLSAEPRQEPSDMAPFERWFGGHRYRLTPRFRWDESARVVSEKPYRWGRTAAVLPEDLALGWGPVVAAPYVGKVSYSQYARFYFW